MAKEYIERKRAIVDACNSLELYPSEYAELENALNRIPAADVATVRHGWWFDSGDYVTTAYGSLPVKMCSECHMDVTLDDFDNYCPNCGAKMDKEEVCKENTKNT